MNPPITSTQRRNIGFKLLFSFACTVIVVAGLKAAEDLIVPVLLGVFLAVLTLPLTGWLHSRGLPRPLAVIVAVLLDLLVLVLLAFIIVSVLPDFHATAQKYETKFREFLMTNAVSTQNWLNSRLGPLQEWMAQNFGEPNSPATVAPPVDLKSAAEQLLTMDSFLSVVNWVNQVNIVPWVISIVTKAFFALIIMVFVLIEAEKFAEKVGPMIDARGPNFRRFRTIGRELQYYLAIKTLASLATGILMGLSCWLTGVEFAFAWGLIAFIFNFIPTVGAVFSAIPPVLVALLQVGFWQCTVLVLMFLAIHIMVGNFIEPMVMGRGFGISTVVVILSVLFWGWLWGLVGMFLAVPLTMFIKMMLDESDDFRWVAVAMSKHREEGILELLEAEQANNPNPEAKPADTAEDEELSAAGL